MNQQDKPMACANDGCPSKFKCNNYEFTNGTGQRYNFIPSNGIHCGMYSPKQTPIMENPNDNG